MDLDFNKLNAIAGTGQSVIPVIVQHALSNEVLTLAYVNEHALKETLKTGIATFWSTSRNTLWVKGSTSGNYLKMVEVRVNCDNNSLLFKVLPGGDGVCHVINSDTGAHWPSCYFRRFDPAENPQRLSQPSKTNN